MPARTSVTSASAVNLRHLLAFTATARLGSISAAARVVHLSQPAVTQAIAGIERYFGGRLLHRGARGATLTTAGRVCAQRGERALQQLREALAEVAKKPANTEAVKVLRAITIAQLHALLAVVATRSFSAAARMHGVSQPVIHRAARALERTLGVALFERTSFGITPTRDAERLARRARLAFNELDQARAEVAATKGAPLGHTAIGALPLARAHLLPAALIEFGERHPTHRVAIVEGAYEYLLNALRGGEVDFLVGAMRDPTIVADVAQEHLFDDPLCIVMRAHHPLARRRRASIHALLKYPWVAPRESSPLHVHFDDLFSYAGVHPPAASIQCNSLAAARALLIESDRLMLLSAHQIYYELRAGMLATLPHPRGRITRSIGLTFRRDWRPTPIQEQLLASIKARAARVAEVIAA